MGGVGVWSEVVNIGFLVGWFGCGGGRCVWSSMMFRY